jgi:hypothetical protein
MHAWLTITSTKKIERFAQKSDFLDSRSRQSCEKSLVDVKHITLNEYNSKHKKVKAGD